MQFSINQQIYYSNKNWVPAKEVAESLLALDAIIQQTPEVLEALFPGTKIDSVEVFLNELKSDSIWEDVVVKFVFGSQQKFDEVIASARERIGMDKIMNNPQLLSAIILTMVLSGGAYYLGKDQTATPEQRATIEANNNTIIQIGAGIVEMQAEDFKVLIDNAIKDKDKLAKSAVRMVKPAKLDKQATITFNDNQQLQITEEAVQAMPRYIQEPEKIEYIEDFKNVELELRAIDLDSTKRGWAVVVPEIHPRRTRLQLDPTIDPESLLNKRFIKGHITVIFGYDKSNKKIPKLVFLRELVEEK